MKTNAIRKTLAILLSVVLAMPLFVFATFADDPVFSYVSVYSDSVEPGETWYNRAQLRKDTANDNYKDAKFYLSEDGNILKIEYTVDGETQTELHNKAEEPQYFAYLCVLPEFGDALPFSDEGLEGGDYWFDKDGLVELVRSYGMQEDYMYFYTDATYRVSVDGTILRKTVTIAGTPYTTNSDEFLADPSIMCGFLHQVGVDPNAGFILLPTSDEGLQDGDYWFDVETLASAAGEESAQYYRSAQYYLSEDGNTLRMIIAGMKQEFDKTENDFFFAYVRQVGVDPNAGFILLPTSEEGLEDGDYWFDVETLVSAAGEESAQYYRSAQYYLSEDGNTLRVFISGNKMDLEKNSDEGKMFFAYVRQVGVDPNPGFTRLPTSEEGLEDGDYWFDLESLLALISEDYAQYYRDGQYYLSDDGSTMRVIYRGYTQDYTEDDNEGGEFYFGFLRQVGVDPNAGFTLLPFSPEGLEDGAYWFDIYTLAELEGMSDEELEAFMAMSAIYISDDGLTMRFSQGGYTTNFDIADPEYAEITAFLHRVGEDPNAGFTKLPTSEDGLRFGDYWYDAAGLAAAKEEEGVVNAEFYLSDDGNTIRIYYEGAKYDIASDDEYNGETFFSFLHQIGEDSTKAYLTVNTAAETVYTGDVVEMTVMLEQNPGLAGMSLSIDYDSEVLTLTNVQEAGMLASGNLTPGGDVAAQPYNIIWDDGASHENHTETGAILTLTFTVNEDAEAGETTVTLGYASDSTFNVDLQDVPLHISGATLTIVKHTPGDVDGDGEIDLADVTTLCRYLAGGWDATVDARNSDVNGDGVLDLKDVVYIRRFLAGGWNVVLV